MASKVLVSGGNGFIASHVIEQLLAAGHQVVGTVRNPNDADKVGHLRRMAGADSRLTLVAADLNSPGAFDAYVDVDCIFHMASPYVMNVKDAARDLVRPAIDGTLAMLKAAATQARVRRIVLTSSMAAITDEPDGRVLTESDWNDKSSLTRNPYYFSKAEAERTAWAFVERERPSFDLVVINPFLVVGPAHSRDVNTSNQTFIDIAAGTYPAVMDLEWGYVDVRDVATAHVAAMAPGVPSGRYICASGNMTMAEVVELMRAEGFTNTKLPRFDMSGGIGTALMRLMSYSQPSGVGSYLRTHLGRAPRFDSSKARDTLGVAFRPPEESLKDTLADLVRWGHLAPPLADRSPA